MKAERGTLAFINMAKSSGRLVARELCTTFHVNTPRYVYLMTRTYATSISARQCGTTSGDENPEKKFTRSQRSKTIIGSIDISIHRASRLAILCGFTFNDNLILKLFTDILLKNSLKILEFFPGIKISEKIRLNYFKYEAPLRSEFKKTVINLLRKILPRGNIF